PRGNPLPGTVPRARRTGRVRWQTPLRRCALPLAELEAVAERVGDMAAADAGERRVALRPDAGGGPARTAPRPRHGAPGRPPGTSSRRAPSAAPASPAPPAPAGRCRTPAPPPRSR